MERKPYRETFTEDQFKKDMKEIADDYDPMIRSAELRGDRQSAAEYRSHQKSIRDRYGV